MSVTSAKTKATCKCGNHFVKKTKWHEYCSKKCKMKYWIIEKAKELKSNG